MVVDGRRYDATALSGGGTLDGRDAQHRRVRRPAPPGLWLLRTPLDVVDLRDPSRRDVDHLLAVRREDDLAVAVDVREIGAAGLYWCGSRTIRPG